MLNELDFFGAKNTGHFSDTLALPKLFDTRPRRHPSASRPEGPEAPLVRKAACAMVESSMREKMTGPKNGLLH